MLLMGAGIQGGRVVTDWPGLEPSALDRGDLAATIDYRDVLGELLTKRMGSADLGAIFPGHSPRSHGIVHAKSG